MGRGARVETCLEKKKTQQPERSAFGVLQKFSFGSELIQEV